jgi:hypothetical protein
LLHLLHLPIINRSPIAEAPLYLTFSHQARRHTDAIQTHIPRLPTSSPVQSPVSVALRTCDCDCDPPTTTGNLRKLYNIPECHPGRGYHSCTCGLQLQTCTSGDPRRLAPLLAPTLISPLKLVLPPLLPRITTLSNARPLAFSTLRCPAIHHRCATLGDCKPSQPANNPSFTVAGYSTACLRLQQQNTSWVIPAAV